ncbi:MAG: B12-binding domain-containing radical SAM protein [Promethearchaeota archaeon]
MLKEYSIIKDRRNVDFSFALVFPNIYKIGMSSYTIRLLYSLINSRKDGLCERVFLPEKIRFPSNRDYSHKTIRSLETGTPLNQFDVIGFTLQFENDFKNILWIIEKAGIPLTTEERRIINKEKGTKFPLIISGGPVATSNPISFAPYFDFFFIGDAESNLNNFLDLSKKYFEDIIDYDELITKAKSIPGIYIPLLENKVSRNIQENLDAVPTPKYQIISFFESNKEKIFEDKYFVEINRGCPFKCKFCISSFHNRPFRNKSFNKIIEEIKIATNFKEIKTISLIGSCVSAHPDFLELCQYILNLGLRFTIPSIRIEHLTDNIIKILEENGTKTITIAPETGTESLRFSIDKRISDKLIYNTVNRIFESEIENIKFYFLIGLPEEKDEDIDNLIEMIRKFSEMGFKKGALRININPFIPKLNTPYQNAAEHLLSENIPHLREKFNRIQKELNKIPTVKLKFKNINNLLKSARLQAIISLGNKNIAQLLKQYYLNGANFGILRKIEKESGIYIDDYLKKIIDGYTPWKL